MVVHILMDDSCTQGAISMDLVHGQIEILNEDFLALPDTKNGTDTQIQSVTRRWGSRLAPAALEGQQRCGSLDPIDNYIDYSDDLCMRRFDSQRGTDRVWRAIVK